MHDWIGGNVEKVVRGLIHMLCYFLSIHIDEKWDTRHTTVNANMQSTKSTRAKEKKRLW